jgi:hypothetical protein
MATVYADEKGTNYVFVKGAPDFFSIIALKIH